MWPHLRTTGVQLAKSPIHEIRLWRPALRLVGAVEETPVGVSTGPVDLPTVAFSPVARPIIMAPADAVLKVVDVVSLETLAPKASLASGYLSRAAFTVFPSVQETVSSSVTYSSLSHCVLLTLCMAKKQ